MRVSVIIPTLNEREHLPRTIAALRACHTNSAALHEIIIADGGSTDGTCEWLARQSDVQWIRCERGRGAQLRAGATLATGEALLFLHADCLPAPQSLNAIGRTLKNKALAGGCFRIGFAERDAHIPLRLLAQAINVRSRLTRTATGDQGIFVRHSAYQKIGGFQPWPLFEDLDLTKRLHSTGRFVVLGPALRISARRWHAFGFYRTTFLMGVLLLGYHLKVPPARLKRWFTDLAPSPRLHDEN